MIVGKLAEMIKVLFILIHKHFPVVLQLSPIIFIQGRTEGGAWGVTPPVL
jgi:hypothetical protein